MQIYEELVARGLIAQMTDEEQIALLKKTTLSLALRERTINLFDAEDGRNLAVPDAVPVPKTEKKSVESVDDLKKGKKRKNKK